MTLRATERSPAKRCNKAAFCCGQRCGHLKGSKWRADQVAPGLPVLGLTLGI